MQVTQERIRGAAVTTGRPAHRRRDRSRRPPGPGDQVGSLGLVIGVASGLGHLGY